MRLGESSHQRYGAVNPTLHCTSRAAGVFVQYDDMLGGAAPRRADTTAYRGRTRRPASSTVPVLSFVCVRLRVVLLTRLGFVFGSKFSCPGTTLFN